MRKKVTFFVLLLSFISMGGGKPNIPQTPTGKSAEQWATEAKQSAEKAEAAKNAADQSAQKAEATVQAIENAKNAASNSAQEAKGYNDTVTNTKNEIDNIKNEILSKVSTVNEAVNKVETAKQNAENSSQTASSKADEAKNSANEAEKSKTSAEKFSQTASTKAEEAKTAADTATQKANEAKADADRAIQTKNESLSIANNVKDDLAKFKDEYTAKLNALDMKTDLALNGSAAAIAIGNLGSISSNSNRQFQLSAAYGFFGGKHAVALGFSGISNNDRFTYRLSGAVTGNGNLAFGAGAGILFGEKRNTNANYEQLKKEIEELRRMINNR